MKNRDERKKRDETKGKIKMERLVTERQQARELKREREMR